MNIYVKEGLMKGNHLLAYDRSYIMRSAHKQARDFYDKKMYNTYREALSYSLKNCWLRAYKEKLYNDLEIKFLAVKSSGFGIDTGVYCMYEGKKYFVKSYNIIFGIDMLSVTIIDPKTWKIIDLNDFNLKKIKWLQ